MGGWTRLARPTVIVVALALVALVVRARVAVDAASRPMSVLAPEVAVGTVAVVLLAYGCCPPSAARLRMALFAVGLLLGLSTLFLPLALMRFVPEASAAPEASLVVVLGARAYADGTPSLALEDRMATGIELFFDRGAAAILCSGGPGDGEFHEVEVMRRLALETGVPESAIVLDRDGLDTRSTARSAARLLPGRRALAVSQRFHVPRVELAFAREGIDVVGVAAQQTRPLAKRAWFTAREVVAYWAYWVRR